MAPPVAARFVGAALLLLAVVMFAATAVVAAADLNGDLLVVVLVLGVAGVLTLGWYLRSRAYVVRFSDEGYRVRFVRGAGVREASWRQVQEVVTASPNGIPCVVLRLGDDGATTVPVEALAVDREQFVRELRERLRRGSGSRPL